MPFNVQAILHGACNASVDGTNVGYTKGGVKLRQSTTYLDIDADQAAGTIRKDPTMEKMFVTFTMLEAIVNNMVLALNGDVAGSGDVAYGKAEPATTEHTLTLVGKGVNGTTRTYTFYRAVKIDDTETVVGARDAAGELPVVFELLKDPTHGYEFGFHVDA